MKHFNWFAIVLLSWEVYFQVFMVVAIKRLIEALTVNTILSVLVTLILSIVLIITMMMLVIQNESGDK